MLKRHIAPALLAALADTPIVLLHGARQTGKSTLVQSLTEAEYPARYLTLDDAGVLAAARHDPAGFLAGLDSPVVLDEVQRAPGLFLAIKGAVDRERKPGRFLLTGSANVLLVPRLAESLAGRMEVLTLHPLSQGEIEGTRERFIDSLFSESLPKLGKAAGDRRDLVRRMVRGGYPEVITRTTADRRRAWFASYLTTILQRDVRDLASIEGLTSLPRLLALVAARVMGLANFADISRSAGLPLSTVKRYFALLETTFLVHALPAWAKNLGKRLVKAPKLMLGDTGLCAHLLGADEERAVDDPMVFGPLLENFVATELRKQSTWSQTRPQMLHFRTSSGQEVDLALEDQKGRVVGVEVKASVAVGREDWKGLGTLAVLAGKRFHRGVLLYLGAETIPFAKNLHALPVSALWRMGVQR